MTDPTPNEPTPNHPPVVTDTSAPKAIDRAASGTKRMTLRRWVLRVALILAIASPLIFIVAGLGAKVGLWSWQFGLLTLSLKVAPLLTIVALVVGLLALLLVLVIKPRKGMAIAIVAVIIPALCLVNLNSVKTKSAGLPAIHDISTDTQDPPVFGAVIMAERDAMDGGSNTVDYAGKQAKTRQVDANGEAVVKLVSALQTQSYPEVRTLVLSEAPEMIFGRVEQVVQDMGWSIKEKDVEFGRIDATETTFWYGFKDDITIRLRPAQGDGTRLDIRSVSRVGVSDLGANAARIETFLELMAE